MKSKPIGVFDSGMGGLSVLKDLQKALPMENYIYYGDNKNAPYGTRAKKEICALSISVAEKLMQHDIKALVIACNTATSAAEQCLQEQLPIPVIGIEPELIQAKAYAGERQVIVFATEMTLSQERYRSSRQRNCPNAVSIPAPELVLMVERGVLSGEEPERYIREKLAPYPEIGAIVLGCTHFPFLRRAIHSVVPSAELFDGNKRLIASLRSALAQRGLLTNGEKGSVELLTSSDDPSVMQCMLRLMEADTE